MKSYTTLRNLYGTFTKNTATANLTFGDEIINDEFRSLYAKRDWWFLHRLRTLTTTASTQFQNLPYDVGYVESLYVTVGGARYTPKLIMNREEWDLLNETSYVSDFARYAFVYNGQLGLWPTPATSSNVITLNAKIRPIDLSAADITSSTIATATSGSTSITLSGGLTAQMVGLWIRGTFSTTANTGDGVWYEIASVTNGTTGTLVRAYGGNSIVAGTAACTIAQMPYLPEEFHDMPVYKAAATYWYKEDDRERGDSYMASYGDKMKALERTTSPVTDPAVDGGTDQGIINPNLTISF